MTGLVLAIDQGTTSTRLLTATAEGEFRVAHSVRHRQVYPGAGWVEHDPLELLRNVAECIEAAGEIDAMNRSMTRRQCAGAPKPAKSS